MEIIWLLLLIVLIVAARYIDSNTKLQCSKCKSTFTKSDVKVREVVAEYLYHGHCPKCNHNLGIW